MQGRKTYLGEQHALTCFMHSINLLPFLAHGISWAAACTQMPAQRLASLPRALRDSPARCLMNSVCSCADACVAFRSAGSFCSQDMAAKVYDLVRFSAPVLWLLVHIVPSEAIAPSNIWPLLGTDEGVLIESTDSLDRT